MAKIIELDSTLKPVSYKFGDRFDKEDIRSMDETKIVKVTVKAKS